MKSMRAVHVTHTAVFNQNYIDPPKPKHAPAPYNATSELRATFQKLVNKIHASPLLTENLCTSQTGGPAAELLVEMMYEATSKECDNDPATKMVNHHFHRPLHGHTLKLIQDAHVVS